MYQKVRVLSDPEIKVARQVAQQHGHFIDFRRGDYVLTRILQTTGRTVSEVHHLAIEVANAVLDKRTKRK